MCGTPLGAEEATHEVRKTVTAVFADVSGSTALGEQLEGESFRLIMTRYFDELREAFEAHGGTVEKFIGDAVVAVFGVPVAHEDDALRAVRAVSDIQQRLGRLNEELERDWGVQLAIRIGVNTGEVIAGDVGIGASFVSGDTMNVAARLEQAASPGEVLIGEATLRLVRAAVDVEPVEPLLVKGKSRPLHAWRLVSASGAAGYTRQAATVFVGRELELEALRRALERTVAGRRCHLCTVVGAAGIGKSRLLEEFVAETGHARVLVGRCLPYGDGITYWPLAEMVRELVDGDVRRGIEELLPASENATLVAERVGAVLGVTGATGAAEETFWAFRKLFETLAREQPLITIVEDLHWAEPTLLDLLDYLATFTSDAPLLVVSSARADLFDTRPVWAAPRQNSTTVMLEPLPEPEMEVLVSGLPSGTAIDNDARARILEAAEGNPLFVEQMLALKAEDGQEPSSASMPATIQALLTARIDRLPAGERSVIERASIEGRTFHRGALVQLLPASARGDLGTSLMALVRKDFIEPDRADFAGDDAFRFGHILIRDAAYGAMPKKLRAELHERFADWLDHAARGQAGEFEEILGYHLEQAVLLGRELAPDSDAGLELGARAAAYLSGAGRRAFAHGDPAAAANLLSRACDLLPPGSLTRLEFLPELGLALSELGEFKRAEDLLLEAENTARAVGDERIEAQAVVGRATVGIWAGGTGNDAVTAAQKSLRVCERLGEDLGIARSLHLLAQARFWLGQAGAATDAWKRALALTQAAYGREEAEILSWFLIATWFGPTPLDEGLERCREVESRRLLPRRVAAYALVERAPFEAMRGRFDDARDLLERGRAILEDLGLVVLAAGTSQEAFDIEMLAGNLGRAEQDLRSACTALEKLGEKGFLSTRAACLAQVLYLQGAYEEAEQFTWVSQEAGAPDDVDSQARWRSVRAKILARRGEYAEAEKLASRAVELLEPTDLLNIRAEALKDLAEVLALSGRAAEAQDLVERALVLYRQKQNLVAVSSAEALLGRPSGR